MVQGHWKQICHCHCFPLPPPPLHLLSPGAGECPWCRGCLSPCQRYCRHALPWRQADAAGVGVFTSVGVKKTPSCLQVKEANLLFMIDSAILINRKKMCKFLKRCPESCGHVLVIAVSQAQHGSQELIWLKFRLQWAVVALCLAFRAAPEAEKFQSYVGLLLTTCTKCIGTNQQ